MKRLRGSFDEILYLLGLINPGVLCINVFHGLHKSQDTMTVLMHNQRFKKLRKPLRCDDHQVMALSTTDRHCIF
jgi:hypothetical protein